MQLNTILVPCLLYITTLVAAGGPAPASASAAAGDATYMDLLLASADVHVVCASKDSSPTVSDVEAVMDQLEQRKTASCKQHNSGSAGVRQCTCVGALGNAAVFLCDTNGALFAMPCGNVKRAVEEVLKVCGGTGKVGGRVEMGNGQEVHVR